MVDPTVALKAHENYLDRILATLNIESALKQLDKQMAMITWEEQLKTLDKEKSERKTFERRENKEKTQKEEQEKRTIARVKEEEFHVREILNEMFARKEDASYLFSGEDENYMKFSHSSTPWDRYFVDKKQYESLKGVMQYISGLNDLAYLSAFEKALVKYESYVNRPEFKDPYVRDYFVHIPPGTQIEKVPQVVLGEGVLGTCEPYIGRIRVLNTLHNEAFLEVLMHEAFHLHDPGASESKIRERTSERMDQIGLAKTFHH